MNYWNPYMETMAHEALEKIELSNFLNIFAHAKAHSALYRDKLRDIHPEDLRTLDAIRKIPFTETEEMRKYQEM